MVVMTSPVPASTCCRHDPGSDLFRAVFYYYPNGRAETGVWVTLHLSENTATITLLLPGYLLITGSAEEAATDYLCGTGNGLLVNFVCPHL